MSQVEIVVTTTIGTEGARCWQCQHGDAGNPYCSLFCKRRTMSDPGAPWSRLPACIEAECKPAFKGGRRVNNGPTIPRPAIVPPPQKRPVLYRTTEPVKRLRAWWNHYFPTLTGIIDAEFEQILGDLEREAKP